MILLKIYWLLLENVRDLTLFWKLVHTMKELNIYSAFIIWTVPQGKEIIDKEYFFREVFKLVNEKGKME